MHCNLMAVNWLLQVSIQDLFERIRRMYGLVGILPGIGHGISPLANGDDFTLLWDALRFHIGDSIG